MMTASGPRGVLVKDTPMDITTTGKGKGEGKPVEKTGQCWDCQAYGHWSGDPDYPKVQDGT
eukprot:15395749-Heterocapsa_arctica.AAC.1